MSGGSLGADSPAPSDSPAPVVPVTSPAPSDSPAPVVPVTTVASTDATDRVGGDR
ncbi:hypothetical protein J2744_001340 [Halorubrum trapanicum]|uniref:Uncharacterized protein n=1 Tax=Halorubrum trapanicum TaxID=29284 RepID=A0A8J7R7H5_9EURY|nr:hypothetical protein [Halorubrum trapanicum]MBP1901664.1 hypothetical protein [Halorubrum trapanicum]